MRPLIIDAHVHCGRQFREPPQAFEDYTASLTGRRIGGAVVFPPVMEVYDRHDPDFQDDDYWLRRRRDANRYVLTLGGGEFAVFPFLFMWNDFAIDHLTPQHVGIKWHRHPDEPRYHYEDPRCAIAIAEIRRRNLPVCLEEELDHTLRFVNELAPGVNVIIPHCGELNGGYKALCRLGLWERPNVYTDTSVAPTPAMIQDYIGRYGHRRIMFGSDFPFGDPPTELEKVLQAKVSAEAMEAILGGNLEALVAGTRP